VSIFTAAGTVRKRAENEEAEAAGKATATANGQINVRI